MLRRMGDGFLSRTANRARRESDRLRDPGRYGIRLDGVSLVAALGGLTAFVAARQSAFLARDCGDLPIQLARLEVTFDPSRFAVFDETKASFTFLPFIAGPRNCIGQFFSMLESKIILSLLLREGIIRRE